MKKILRFAPVLFFLLITPALMGADGCVGQTATSSSGVNKAQISVTTGNDGLTVEQRNIRDRLLIDNKPGSIKHLYVISSMSGQPILYSTVRGKVTSGSKRLSPGTISGTASANTGFSVVMGNTVYYTNEVLGDDGVYGSSGDYLFWFDAAGRFHQQYTNGCIIHISDQTIPIKGVIINLEQVKE